MRWPLALLAVAGLLLAMALIVTVPPSSGQATETWYARDTTNEAQTQCNYNFDLSLTAGSSANSTNIVGNGEVACFYTPTLSGTRTAGTWQAFVELTATGTGGNPAAIIRVHIVSATGTVGDQICTFTTGQNPSGEYDGCSSAEGQRTLTSERIRLSIERSGGGAKQLDVHYNGAPGGSADTRIVIPEETACSALTVTSSDPAGQLWFNETVEPDGQPFTTEYNVSASFQDGTTPALRVQNDGSANCDITLRLLSDPGTGRSMKWNTTNDAPWPEDAARKVPLDPSSVTVCSGVAPGGFCDIWLWVDFEDALGGSVSVTLRVESA